MLDLAPGNRFAFGVSLPAPGSDIRVLTAALEDLEAADFLVLTGDTGLAPIAALGFLAPRTTIGLVAEVDAGYVEPFFTSKELATLDLVSAGRAGWQLAVDPGAGAARKRGRAPLPPAELTERVVEYATVVRDLWDSWDPDAVVRDRARGLFLRADRVHRLDHAGAHFRVRGPAILPRPVQGHPPAFVRLTGDEHSCRLARAVAEVVRVPAGSAGRARETFPDARVLADVPFDGVSATLAAAERISAVAQGIVVEFGDPGDLAALREVAGGLGERAPRTATLRERLGLPAAISRFVREEKP
ncbi:LLM class flavin-dependent oxidoreductase [Amycolatopsis sp. NPDC051903]|uniref:LLM class flavin-dependent oxidoreductase n=1 Tax=Amycolatopsis sp. NPDC051903 TaxID=3363936 RepID=UPI0037AAA268